MHAMNKAAPKRGRFEPWILVAVLLAALAVRIVFLIQLGRSELSGTLSLDSEFYYTVARNLSAGGSLGAGAFDFNPLYPPFLVAVFRFFGQGLLAPRIIQLLLGLCTIALLYIGGLRLVEGPRKGRPSGSLAAVSASTLALLYSQFVLYEGLLLSTAFEVFLIAASFVLALALDEDLRGERPIALGTRRIPRWIAGLLLGALCGLGALARPNLFLLLTAAIPLWLAVRSRRKWLGLAPAVSCIAGAALFLAPPIVHNARATGRLVPVTAHGGINFYLGNRSGGSGVFQALDGMPGDARGSLEEARRRAERQTGRRMTNAEASDYYMRRALGEISRDPAAWLRLMGRKLLYFFNGVELYDVPNVYFCEIACSVLRLLLVPFSVIAPLAICGFVVLFRSGRNRSVVAMYLGCAVVSVLLFYVNTRYRLPSVPLLILLASFFIAWAAREVSRRRLKNVAITAAAAVALFVLVSNRSFVKMNHSAAYAFLGNHYIETGDEAKAEQAFAEAYRRDPRKIEAILNYARILGQRGKSVESVDMFARAYERMPHFPHVALEYGRALESLGRTDAARRLYLEAAASGRADERELARTLLERLERAP